MEQEVDGAPHLHGFCAAAWASTAGLRAAIDAHPFLAELADGSLPPSTFARYIVQDALYLRQFSRALAGVGARLPEATDALAVWKSAATAVEVERALHGAFLHELGVPAHEFERAEPSPACAGYTGFLLGTVHTAPVEVSVAAVLPCFWVYLETGCRLLEDARQTWDAQEKAHPYQKWLDTYAGDAFEKGVRSMQRLANRLFDAAGADVRCEMYRAFAVATRHEYCFWDGAYTDVRWPLDLPSADLQ